MIYLIYRTTIDWKVIDLDNSTPLTEALFYILLAVRTPNHGYGIIQDGSEMTNGRVTLGPGTLYGAINSMLTDVESKIAQYSKIKNYFI